MNRTQGYACLAAAMALVGSTVVASKVIAAGLPPFTATAMRFALALPCFALLGWLAGARLPRLDRRDWLLLAAQAVAGSVGYTTLLIAGLRRTSAVDGGVILGTLPLVSAAVAIAVLGERPGKATLLAIATAAAGVWLMTHGDAASGAGSWIGNALVLGAVLCEGLFILLQKRLRAPVPPLALSTLMCAIGLAVCLPASLAEAPWTLALSAEALLAVAYYALVPTVAGFVLWYAGAERVAGSEAALFTAIAPVSAVLLAALLLDESMSARQLAGMACVLGAVLILGRTRKPATVAR
ncbi:DMT family transporter [Achromobacter xylosoxidans]|uniref:DMT family transporter n=1 Tax=Alcaligenes xylosoxydans xylosoxydans TaxID=85698 RepID=UPI0006C52F77|nr:DMT family transporter [Achromobacter xylosoxidans]MDC6164518.1 DMT family transporter [Achromobacter xylosoxidans]PWV39820.1 EamA/RhaT family transporter [Achromobacter xylosoxidans]QEQ25197.1 DMT family transporter [Achromobacter xylosoxidans]CUI81334.1 putative DMT superfamily transporter inner membrane protein [Achromobacter xylosoxidans]CUJ42816.1 putative DMT superfamily transporter inner membrane protein [Achromobacter xylosoxidans]